MVGVGLVTYGIVHLLIAWIAVRIAWTGRGNDSQDAALAALAETVYGETLLWITAVGLAALTLWQIFETIWRRAPDEGRITKVFGRTGSLFSAAAYLTARYQRGPGGAGGACRPERPAHRRQTQRRRRRSCSGCSPCSPGWC